MYVLWGMAETNIFVILLCPQRAKGINPLPLKGLGHCPRPHCSESTSPQPTAAVLEHASQSQSSLSTSACHLPSLSRPPM